MNRLAFWLAPSLVAVVAACAWRSEDAEPVPVAIAIDFPSTDAAVAIDHITVIAYDGATSCAELLRKRSQGEPMPVARARQSAEVCRYFRGEVVIEMPLGARSLLAIAERGSSVREEVLMGCVEQTLGEGDALLPIKLSRNASSQGDLPPTSCTSLADLCAGVCQ